MTLPELIADRVLRGARIIYQDDHDAAYAWPDAASAITAVECNGRIVTALNAEMPYVLTCACGQSFLRRRDEQGVHECDYCQRADCRKQARATVAAWRKPRGVA
jgi:hypothetical protein